MTWKRVRHLGIDEKVIVNEEGRVMNASSCHEYTLQEKHGYKFAVLHVNGKLKWIGVHRLVCAAFHGAPPTSNHEPDHINGDRSDNRPSNLEWVTHKENIRRARSKPVRGVAANGAVIQLPYLAMASELGFDTGAIRKAISRNNTRRSQGYVWEYI